MSQFSAHLLRDRVALVTGASSGLGRHFALSLARHGAQVVIAARRVDALEALAEEIAQFGGVAHVVVMDVRKGQSVVDAVADAVARTGRLDILVNNAGVAVTKTALLTSEDDWLQVIDTNLNGAFRVARAVAATMANGGHGGAIVNIASVLGVRVTKQVAAYIAAKAALLKLTEALALEWSTHGIRVNAIAPGYIRTDLNESFLNSASGQAMSQRIPLRRFGTSADLDGALLLLASELGGYITGTTITVDGGHSLAWL